ncbi:MAG TPA: ATP-binding protein, partial [Solirubrobacterales bacterium]|nr:ATP-binding protein [Solirubrobacterales bacterium]
VLANRQAEQLFGYPREELLQGTIEWLVPERFRPDHAHHLEAFLSSPRNRPMGIGLELSGRRKDGSEFPADISLSSIKTNDGILSAAAIRDLTKRVEAERERRALEAEAKEARTHQARRLEGIGELAGGIAHDFNNLLAVILNNAEMALEDITPGTQLEDGLREIYGAAENASRLTNQLLIFSRREITERLAVDLNEVVHELQRLLARVIGEHIEMQVRLDDDLPPVMASPSQLEQVILNLAINSRDAMPGGGRLGIETTTVELDEEYARTRPDVEPGEYVRLTVADDGEGMSSEVVARAFEPFFTTKEAGGGTGLGLATVYGIVKQSGGHVAIYSEPDGGAVVRVHLPAARGIEVKRRRPSDQAGDTEQGGGRTVLVVEDSEGVRRNVCRILERAGYRVLQTDRGSEALSICDSPSEEVGEINLVITDLVMPGMLGTELAEHLQRARPELPVLFMSGYADVARPVSEDATLIEKPFTSARLLERVADALESGDA